MFSSGSLPKRYLRKEWFLITIFLFGIELVQATKPKTLGNEPEEIVNEDLGYISQIFLPKKMGNDPKPCGFVYVIAPQKSISFFFSSNFESKNYTSGAVFKKTLK